MVARIPMPTHTATCDTGQDDNQQHPSSDTQYIEGFPGYIVRQSGGESWRGRFGGELRGFARTLTRRVLVREVDTVADVVGVAAARTDLLS